MSLIKAVEIWRFGFSDILDYVEESHIPFTDEDQYRESLHKVYNCPEAGCPPKYIYAEEGTYTKFIESRDVDSPEWVHMTEVKSMLGIKSILTDYQKISRELKHSLADKFFRRSLDDILANGINTADLPCSDVRTKWADGTPAHYIYVTNKIFEYDLSEGYFPLISYRKQAWKSAVKEILWIYQDQTNELSVLKDKHDIHWWDQHTSKDMPGTIGQRYGATIKRYDLINKLLESLSTKGSNRRLVVDMLQYTDLDESDGLYPCAYSTTWNVRGEYLDMILNQRSSDFLMAWSINQAQYAALLIMVAKAVGLKPGKFMHVIGNLHIYDRHLPAAIELSKREPKPESQPIIKFEPESTEFYSFKIEDFVLESYVPNAEQIKLEIAI